MYAPVGEINEIYVSFRSENMVYHQKVNRKYQYQENVT